MIPHLLDLSKTKYAKKFTPSNFIIPNIAELYFFQLGYIEQEMSIPEWNYCCTECENLKPFLFSKEKSLVVECAQKSTFDHYIQRFPDCECSVDDIPGKTLTLFFQKNINRYTSVKQWISNIIQLPFNFMISEDLQKQVYSRHKICWRQLRLLFVAIYKESPKSCNLSRLPKDLFKYIFTFLFSPMENSKNELKRKVSVLEMETEENRLKDVKILKL